MTTNELGEKQEVKPYILVFVALMALTLITVAVSYLELPTVGAVALALVIASVKGSLVACYFMHLLSEKKLILLTMAFTILGFLAVLLGPAITEANTVTLD
ncbi:MAG: cytochrome C oxidase subunit IV family protein [Thermoanaerobaculia bacterium]|nr:cytochrome C oxidase subunit IV family protein [Thermoanaerobaculia bacterium]